MKCYFSTEICIKKAKHKHRNKNICPVSATASMYCLLIVNFILVTYAAQVPHTCDIFIDNHSQTLQSRTFKPWKTLQHAQTLKCACHFVRYCLLDYDSCQLKFAFIQTIIFNSFICVFRGTASTLSCSVAAKFLGGR